MKNQSQRLEIRESYLVKIRIQADPVWLDAEKFRECMVSHDGEP